LTRQQLAERYRDADALDAALARLLARGRIREAQGAGAPSYSSAGLSVGFDEPAGWEAAVWDHYQAMVQTITAKLARETSASRDDTLGGSTYTFVVWPGHPLEAEVLGQLARYRAQQSDLRARVDGYNVLHGVPTERTEVLVYAGQCVREGAGQEAGHAHEENGNG
jgi:hypothetical protein